MSNPTAAMLVIGDEILSGRTRDANMFFLAGELAGLGIDLKEVRVVGDDHDGIVGAVNELRRSHDMLFTSGGIGPTHDDITADAVAAALEKPISIRDDAKKILEDFYGANHIRSSSARMRMARVPEDATLIRNDISRAPGFSVENVHVMAGVPAIFRAMVGALLDRLPKGRPLESRTVKVFRPESEIAESLEEIVRQFPELRFGSYPFRTEQKYGANLVVRGASAPEVESAAELLVRQFPGDAEFIRDES